MEIIESYFSEADAPPLTSFTAPLDILKLLEEERLRYQQLYLDFEWLKGEYALATTRLLPAAELVLSKKPWHVRLKNWLVSR